MLYWAYTQISEPILEGFGSISYHFRDSEASLTSETRGRGGLPPCGRPGRLAHTSGACGGNEKEST
jgi:hypothetical protein